MRSLIARLATLVPTLVLATIFVFSITRLIPGDPADILLGDTATPEQIEALRVDLGLNKPFYIQYFKWLGKVLVGDLGKSIFFQQPVTEVIADGAETSFLLASMTMLWIFTLGLPIGILAAAKHGSWVDQGFSGAAMIAASIPTFWLGLYLILIFAANLGWLPSSGYPSIFEEGGLANLRYLLLPSLALAAPNTALIIRLTRAEMLDVIREDFVRTARAKGLAESSVLFRHVFRNALTAVTVAFGFTFAVLVSEAVVTETVFSLPGIGRLVVQSVLRRDYPIIQGVILCIVVIYMFVNLAVDLMCVKLDPRIKF